SVLGRHGAQRRRWGLSLAYGKSADRRAGGLHSAVLSFDLHTPKAQDSALHTAGSVSGRHADTDWLGWRRELAEPRSLVPLRSSVSVAVSSFPGNRAPVPGRLRARRLPDVAGLRPRWPITRYEIVSFTVVLVLATLL